MYYSRHDTGLDTSTRLPRERTAYPPAGFNYPYPGNRPSNPSLEQSTTLTPLLASLCFSLSAERDSSLLSPSLENCYRTIQPRMQIAALSRVSRMTFDEIRFRGKEKETRMSLSRSLPPPSPLSLPRIRLLLLSHSESLPPAGRRRRRRKIHSFPVTSQSIERLYDRATLEHGKLLNNRALRTALLNSRQPSRIPVEKRMKEVGKRERLNPETAIKTRIDTNIRGRTLRGRRVCGRGESRAMRRGDFLRYAYGGDGKKQTPPSPSHRDINNISLSNVIGRLPRVAARRRRQIQFSGIEVGKK